MAATVTFPFIIHPSNTLTAPLWGDIASSVSRSEAIKGGHANPFSATKLPWISYPDGPKNNVGVTRVSAFSELYLWITTKVTNAITSHSLLAMLGYILTAFVTFLFVRQVTKSAPAAFIAGYIYGFWPHMYLLARADMTYTHMWLYILPIWAFWFLSTRGYTRKRVALATASIIPAFFWTPYYTFHILIVGGCGLIVAFYFLYRQNGPKTAFSVSAIVSITWLALLGMYRLIGLSSAASDVPIRTIAEIYDQSAHPLMYVLPGMFSWGAHGNALLLYLVPRATSVNIYIGITVLMLALIGIASLYARRNEQNSISLNEQMVAALIAGLVVLACFLFSLPPTVRLGSLSLPTPNLLVANVVPALRAGQRFVMPLMGGLAVLAGIGAYQLLRRFQPRPQILLAIVMIIILWADLHVTLPRGSISTIRKYPSLSALGAQPLAPTAQFHQGSLLNDPNQLPCLIQPQHNKPLINDCGLGRSRDLGQILKLPLCEEITALRAIGTRYLILDPSNQTVIDCLGSQHIIEQIISDDGTYKVISLIGLDDAAKVNIRANYNLP